MDRPARRRIVPTPCIEDVAAFSAARGVVAPAADGVIALLAEQTVPLAPANADGSLLRPILATEPSEYHDGGAVTGMFTVRHGRYKYVHYPGFAPKLLDLEADPDELGDLGGPGNHARARAECEAAVRARGDFTSRSPRRRARGDFGNEWAHTPPSGL